MSKISTRVREEGFPMSTYSTISDRTAHMPGLQLRVIVPNRVRLAVRPLNAHAAQLTSWPQVGMANARGAITAQQHQGGRIAGFGGCNVTDSKFSTRVGPPSCSPPV